MKEWLVPAARQAVSFPNAVVVPYFTCVLTALVVVNEIAAE